MIAMLLASPYRRSEDVSIISIVVSKLKFSVIEMQVFFADFMERSDNATFQDRPEALNRVGMNRANNVLANAMVYGCMREAVVHPIVTGPSICVEQTDASGYGLLDKSFKNGAACVLNDARDDVALTLDRAYYRSLARVPAPANAYLFVPMAVPVVSANVGFINLNNSAKLLNVLGEGDPDFVTHEPSGLVGTEPEKPLNLQRAHILLADKHQMRNSKPVLERLVRVLKDCAGQMRETTAVRRELAALPMMTGRKRIDFWVAAARTGNLTIPSASDQIGDENGHAPRKPKTIGPD